jgi:hypothetical protein
MARLFGMACLAFIGLAPRLTVSAEVQPRSYSSLFAKSTVVAAGTVRSVSSGFMSQDRNAQVEVDGLFKGKLRRKILQVSWKEAEFPETAYKEDTHVILFVIMRKDSSFAQVSPGISCWPVEKVQINGKPAKAVEYSYPMDLVTGLPKGVFRETEVVEKSLNFQIPKRKKWIMTDALLPAMHPLRLPKKKKR